MFLLDFGPREVSQRQDLEILLQVGSGRARDDFKMPRSGTGTFFEKAYFEDFLSKSISYASPRPIATTKVTASGFSCYGLFTKTIAFAEFLQCVATLFMKSHFFILSLPRSLLKGFRRFFVFFKLLAGNVFFYLFKKHGPGIFRYSGVMSIW